MYSENIINKEYWDLNPVLFGYENCEKSHAYGPAIRTYWLFHYVVSGKGTFQIGKRKYKLSRGMMFVIPPFVETYYQADAQEPWEYIWVGFTGEPPLDMKDTYQIPQALRIFEHMKASRNIGEGKTEFILGKLWELFSVLMAEKKIPPDPVETALNMIHAEYMHAITIQSIADRICLDRTYFSNLFRQRIGMSPKQYLLKHRMEQAMFFLQDGYSITLTACSVGYQDIYTFSKMFKHYFGKAPSHYRTN